MFGTLHHAIHMSLSQLQVVFALEGQHGHKRSSSATSLSPCSSCVEYGLARLGTGWSRAENSTGMAEDMSIGVLKVDKMVRISLDGLPTA